MGMEKLASLPAEFGLHRSPRVRKKARKNPVIVIDLDDDEIEEWPRSPDQVEEKVKRGLYASAGNPVSFSPMFGQNAGKVKICVGLEISDRKAALPCPFNAAPQPVKVESNDQNDFVLQATGIDLDDSEVLTAIMDDDAIDSSFGEANSLQAGVIDLSSTESSDEEDGYEEDGDKEDGDINGEIAEEQDGDEEDGDSNGEIAEEQEEIVTTLSREDSVVFAEVMKAIGEGSDLRKFKVDQLKTYLRHHGLRMVGVKFVLLNRIQEHQRLKDRAQEIYPRSSFSINCKGDVCLGDSVLFLQKVFDTPLDCQIRRAGGSLLGDRWVAGKVVSESYGAEKQQHTFTIEVLWSTGVQPFYCMRPIKIKGRNLYRVVTMRQPWSKEPERQKVLDEKHARGAAARAIRRAVTRPKSKGKPKLSSRVLPEPHDTPPDTQQNASIHNHQHGKILIHTTSAVRLHSSMQHGTYTERRVYQASIAIDNRAPPAHHQSPPRARMQEHRRIHAQTQISAQNHPSNGHHQKVAPTIPCSNTKCEKAGAMRCITRSCGQCCSRSTTKGKCQRHR